MEKYIGKYSVKDFLYLILGAFIYSIGTHSFIETANIAPGGAVGVALMLNHVTNLPVGRLTLMVNVPLLILAWFHLSRAFALRTAPYTPSFCPPCTGTASPIHQPVPV